MVNHVAEIEIRINQLVTMNVTIEEALKATLFSGRCGPQKLCVCISIGEKTWDLRYYLGILSHERARRVCKSHKPKYVFELTKALSKTFNYGI